MLNATLKLVTPDPKDNGPLPFERRRNRRHTARSRVTALCERPGESIGNKKICSLQLRDLSDGGLGAQSDEPVEMGSLMTIFFPAHGPEGGFDAVGRVVRCEPEEGGFSVGVHLRSQTRGVA